MYKIIAILLSLIVYVSCSDDPSRIRVMNKTSNQLKNINYLNGDDDLNWKGYLNPDASTNYESAEETGWGNLYWEEKVDDAWKEKDKSRITITGGSDYTLEIQSDGTVKVTTD